LFLRELLRIEHGTEADMRRNRPLWALSVLVFVFTGESALAQTRPQPSERGAGYAYRVPDRFLALDLNHDGNITRDEMNRAESARFASATHGAAAMTREQFAGLYLQQSQQRTDALFRKLDWNGDGKLSLEEYAEPKRARFETFEDIRREESCANAHVIRASFDANRGARESGRAKFCDDNDLNRDGKVTHAEFDSVTVKEFAARTGGAKLMSEAQFRADTDGRERSFAIRAFLRLDANGDGKLSPVEFAASDQKLFARLDSNHDGIVSASELSSSTAPAYRRNRS
jgi:Ca2+-binding EF-hand superfamily protein